MTKAFLSAGFGLLLAFAFGGAALAQNPSEARLAKATEIVEITGAADGLIHMSETMLPGLLQAQRKAHPEIAAEFWDEFSTAFQAVLKTKAGAMAHDIAQLYADEFTEAEMDAMIQFYRTPAGAKMIKTVPDVMRQSIQIGQRWGQQIVAESLKQAQQNFKQKTQAK